MTGTVIATSEEIRRTLERLALEILERHGDCAQFVILGIQRRGVDIARRLRDLLETRLGCKLLFGELDINFYRDDWTNLQSTPLIGRTSIPFSLEDCQVLLVDDVLFTGRTIRAALEAIIDHGRPSKVELLVLIDRGNREFPIQADYVGKHVATSKEEHVDVLVTERDGKDEVVVSR